MKRWLIILILALYVAPFGTKLIAQSLAIPIITKAQIGDSWGLAVAWTEVPQAVRYTIDVAIDSTFETFVPGLYNKDVPFLSYSSTPPTGREIVISNLRELGIYYVRVRAQLAQGWSPYSAYRSISLGGVQPQPMLFVNTARLGNNNTIEVQWNRIANANSYQIQIFVPIAGGVHDVYASKTIAAFTTPFKKDTLLLPISAKSDQLLYYQFAVFPSLQERTERVFLPSSALWPYLTRFENVAPYQIPQHNDSTYFSYTRGSGLLSLSRQTEKVDSLLLDLVNAGMPLESAWFLDGPTDMDTRGLLVKLRRYEPKMETYQSNGSRLWRSGLSYLADIATGISTVLQYTFNARTTDVTTPQESQLLLNISPNPSGDVARITWQQDAPSEAQLSLVDVLGQEMRSVAAGFFAAGQQSFSLSTRELPAGVYTVRVRVGAVVQTSRLVVVR